MEASFYHEKTSKTEGILKASGSLCASDSAKFSKELESLIESGCSDIILNLDDADYISSSCIKAMEKALDSVYEKDGSLTIESKADQIRKILEIAGYDELLSDFEPQTEE